MKLDVDVMMDPNPHGLVICTHCNGYGSSFKDPIGVNRCTRCEGNGLVRKDLNNNAP